MSSAVRVECVDGICTITLARPEKRNALSPKIVEALLQAIEHAPDEGARVLVLRGEGACFSAGFDFSGLDTQSEGDLVLRFVRIETLPQTLAASPCLTVALVHGSNFGAGVDLAACCRLRLCTPDASFRMPGLKFGLVLGTRRFADIVGAERAARILQEAARFDAAQALHMGFVHDVVDAAEWPGKVIAARQQASVLADTARGMLYRTLSHERSDADLALLVRSASTPGLKERIAAYLRAGPGAMNQEKST